MKKGKEKKLSGVFGKESLRAREREGGWCGWRGREMGLVAGALIEERKNA